MTNNNLTLFGEDMPVKKTRRDFFSYSKIDLFLQCPFRYKCAKDNLPHKYQNSFYIKIGRSIHHTLKSFFEFLDSKDRNSENLTKLLKYHWENPNLNLDESFHWFETVNNSLINFLDIDKAYCSNIETLEEQYFRFELKNNILDGTIDRIDMISENEIELIDYKTGDFSGNTEENIKADLQWLFYFLGSTHIVLNKKSKDQEDKDKKVRSYLGKSAVQKNNNNIIIKFLNKELKPSKITFYYILAGQKISFTPTEKEILKNTNDLIIIINKIKTTNNFEPTPNKFCDNCSLQCNKK